MRRNWTILVVITAILAVLDGGKYLGMVVLTFLMPIYALLLASIIFFVFLITAAVTVPIGQKLLDRSEAKMRVEEKVEDRREAA